MMARCRRAAYCRPIPPSDRMLTRWQGIGRAMTTTLPYEHRHDYWFGWQLAEVAYLRSVMPRASGILRECLGPVHGKNEITVMLAAASRVEETSQG